MRDRSVGTPFEIACRTVESREQGMISKREHDFIDSLRVAHLATVDGSGQPHVVPVCFAYIEGCFYIAIDEKPKRTMRLKRVRNIEKNPPVALVFNHYDEDWRRLGWVMVQGAATIIDGGVEHGRAVAALRSRYDQYRSMALEGRPLIRVSVEKVVSWGNLA